MPRKDAIDQEARAWIVELLKDHMRRVPLTPAEVHRRTGISESTLSHLLNGRVKGLGLDNVLKLHRGLHISGDLLLGAPDWKRLGRSPPSEASPSAQPGRSERNGAVHPRDLNEWSATVHERETPYGANPKKARRS